MKILTFSIILYTFALMRKSKQLQFDKKGFRQEKSEHGGSYKNPQKRKRPLGLRSSTHVVLRSTKAKGGWSFTRNHKIVKELLTKFSRQNHIKIINCAIVSNHIHLHLKVLNRKSYKSFIRALTSALYIRITGFSRWNKAPKDFQFWDQRPFSRIIATWKEYLTLKNYVEVNRWEGLGFHRRIARDLLSMGTFAPEQGFC